MGCLGIEEKVLRSLSQESIDWAIKEVEKATDVIHEQGVVLNAIAGRIAPRIPFEPPKKQKLTEREAWLEAIAREIAAKIFADITSAIDKCIPAVDSNDADELETAIARQELTCRLRGHIRCELTLAASSKIARKTGILLKLAAAGVAIGIAYLVIEKIRDGEDEMEAFKKLIAEQAKEPVK